MSSSASASSTLNSSGKQSTSLSSQTHASSSLKTRVRSIDPNSGHCLIENVPNHCMVDFVHCFPKRKAGRQSLIASLEWHWNMVRGTLNLDTRYNVFRVRPHLHRLYESPNDVGSWMLVPEEHIVDRYFDYLTPAPLSPRAERTSFPLINNATFLYRFTPLPTDDAIRDLVITRQDAHEPKDSSQNGGDHTLHVYPFDTLPLVESHLHPKFAIMGIGRKINEFYKFDDRFLVMRLVHEQPILLRICKIYSAWTEPCPSKEFIWGTGLDSKSSIKSSTNLPKHSSSTPPPVWRPYLKRRFYKCAPGKRCSVTPTRKKDRKRCLNHLCRKTLREHTRMLGKQKWDSESVEQWVDSCALSPNEQSPLGDPH